MLKLNPYYFAAKCSFQNLLLEVLGRERCDALEESLLQSTVSS